MTGAADGSTDWRQLREFADVDLSRSYVLSWYFEAGVLFVDVDVFLTAGHPFYEKPRPAEKFCIRAGCIEFPFCESVGPDGKTDGKPIDIARKLGPGAITGLRRMADQRYEISGDFGTVLIDAERPLLKLKQT